MGQQQSAALGGAPFVGGANLDLDDDLLTRASELLNDAQARKRNRDDEPAAPPAMFSLPTSLPKGLPNLAASDDYTNAVLAAASAYLSSGGKACKPIGSASAGSIGRKGIIVPEPSESSVDSRAPAVPESPVSTPAANMAATQATVQRPPLARAVVFKCRRCGSAKRSHQCAEHSEPVAGGEQQRLIPWTAAEDEVICAGVDELGFKWSHIAARLDGRTDNAVRNRWHRLEAARKWRMQVHGAGGEGAELPGYKCGRCGQPKRGHACPFGPDGTVATRVESSESMLAQPCAPALPAQQPSSVCAEQELAELFASLEASPACDEEEYDENAIVELVQDIISPHELEQFMSGRDELLAEPAPSAADECLQWQTLHSQDGTTWHQPIDEEGEWVHGEELSADGAVCF